MPLWNGAPLLNLVYPVGSIYLSSKNTNPGTLFGGTWVQIKDRFILTAGDYYSNGATGGAATVTLTVSNMPSHKHSFTPSGTVSSHSHSFTPSGTVGSHTHSFTPSGTVGSHTHTGPSHTHSFSGNTGEMSQNSSGTVTLGGTEILDSVGTGNIKNVTEWSGGGHGGGHTTERNITKIEINVSHTHRFSGTTGEAGTGNTGSTTPSFTGTAGNTGSTTPSFTGTSGYTGDTAPSFTGTSGYTGSNGSGTSFSILPPYVVKYCWERTA